MIPAKLPENEAERLEALARFSVLDTAPESVYDDIAKLAASICGTPIALISLVDRGRQWFKARHGLDATETPREMAFCAHSILEPAQPLVVEDAACDPRFADNPLVQGGPNIRFYAGVPIVTEDGFALGTVCAIDRVPRHLDRGQLDALASLSRLTFVMLERSRLARLEERHAAQMRMREIEHALAVAVFSTDLMAYVDNDFVFRYANPTYLEYHDLTNENLLGRTAAEIFGADYFEGIIKPEAIRARAGEVAYYKTVRNYKNRGPRHMDVSVLPVRDDDGQVVGTVLRARDITPLVARTEELAATVASLEQKTMALQRFVHILSHDLREPLNSIVNFATLLDSDKSAALDDTARNYLARVLGGGRRLKNLLDDLLELLRLEHAPFSSVSVDMNELYAEVVSDLDAAVKRTGATLTSGALPVVSGERHLLRILLQNLVANAIKFHRKDVAPKVNCEALPLEEGWELRVSDNGTGIPADKLEVIFELFQRLHSRKEYEGTGLGLSICRRIAELHGGRIWASSDPRGGACFHLWLPTRMAAAPNAEKK
ncbi:MAG: sensor histidine kinase [Burkholderiales bacterium]